MRKILVIALGLLFCFSSVAQQTAPAGQLSKDEYLKKSKSQKTTAWILTAGGGAMLVTGLVFVSAGWDYFESETIGTVLMAGGAAAVTGGIILFSAAKRNQEKANAVVALNLKLERTQMYSMVHARNVYPALSVRIGLNQAGK